MEQYPNMEDALKVLENDSKIFLYMDFNGCIHPCVAKIIDRHLNKKQVDKQQVEKEIFIELKRHTLELIEKIKPSFVMISVDGVAPRAKMEQQRTRRYKSIIEKKQRRHVFDTNAISPGTPFMLKLTEEMKDFIKQELIPRKVRTLFLDHSKAGEGEHKIIQFIKDFKHSDKVTHIIYGLDADLIMLSLTTGLNNIYLLREKQLFQLKAEDDKKKWNDKGRKTDNQIEDKMEKVYSYVSIGKFRTFFWNDVNKDFNFSDLITQEQFFRDFVFVCFMIGNDFLPHLKVINIYNDGVDLLLEKYLEQLKITKTPLLSEDLTINQEMLLGMMKDLNDNEDMYVNKNNKRGKDKVIQYYNKGWKNRYYNYYFYGQYDNNDIHNVCKNYCEILKWTTEYYFQRKTANWSMYYHFSCAPCFSDLYTYLQNNNINDIQIPHNKPYTPHQQLMIILPPQSAQLIPKKYHYIMLGRYKKYYPRHFEIDRVDKLMRWMAEPVLPEMCDQMILDLVQ